MRDEEGVQVAFNFSPKRRHSCTTWLGRNGTVSGLLDMTREDFEACEAEGGYADLLTQHFPQFPLLWVPLISRQLSVSADNLALA